MRRLSFSAFKLSLRFGSTTVTAGLSWLIVIPLGLWATATVYVPILGAFMTPVQAWGVALLVGLLVGISLIIHVLTHMGVARATSSEMPAHIPLYPLGDAAQVWPAARSGWGEVLGAIAGPLASVVLAGLAYLVWDAQLNPYLNIGMPFLIFFNAGLAIVNLVPTFPLDGGRFLRAIIAELLRRPAHATVWGIRFGFALVVVLIIWANILLAQRTRYSILTSITTFVFAALILLGLALPRAWKWDRPVQARGSDSGGALLRTVAAIFLFVCLVALTIALVPTNDGLELPGVAPSVAPMIEVPPEYRHPFTGTFILTTVIQQTPITVGEWVFGRLSPIGPHCTAGTDRAARYDAPRGGPARLWHVGGKRSDRRRSGDASGRLPC